MQRPLLSSRRGLGIAMRTLVVSLGLLVLAFASRQSPGATGESVDYTRDIKPIFHANCTMCHGPDKSRAGLRLDTAALALKGGTDGKVIVPGKSAESKLYRAVSGKGEISMPKDRPRLPEKQIALLKAWIDQGATAPKDEVAAVAEGKSSHWAFQAIKRPSPPDVKDIRWVRNPIDRFILQQLERQKIAPAAEADRVTLIRRLSLDLLGLPPSIQDVDDFVKDTRPDAYERLVDRLLSSPHYGERWGRHWLDVARYADSNGFSIDAPRSIWPYRDWVIGALNRDLPFDEFVIQQMAGDLLPDATLDMRIATGFHRNTPFNEEGGIDLEQFRQESVVDRVNTIGTAFLGLTIACAQCHDHKFDPFSQKEYFQLFAFMNNDDEPPLPLPTTALTDRAKKVKDQIDGLRNQVKALESFTPERTAAWEKNLRPDQWPQLPPVVRDIIETPHYRRTAKEIQTLASAIRKADQIPQVLAGLGSPLLGGGPAGRTTLAAHLNLALFRAGVEKKIEAAKRMEPKPDTTLVLVQRKSPRTTHIHIKGDFARKGKLVMPGVPQVLHPLPQSPRASPNSGASPSPEASLRASGAGLNRLDLARWLVDPTNPLTARVTMNRVWQAYFGTGIVETDNDFGTQGTPPSHPELLDWLAAEFMDPSRAGGNAWSLKSMHRLIVTSATYRQSSKARPELATIDARNRLLARQNRLRLEAEVVRDAALASSGLLVRKVGGPSVFPPQPAGVFAFTQVQRQWEASAGLDRFRRGLYTHFWRSAPHPALMAFDAPESAQTCTRRNRSNTPLQALTLLNDQAFAECAQGLALRVLKDGEAADSQRLRHAFRLCVGRPPRDAEENRLAQLLRALQTELAASPEEARGLAPPNLPLGLEPTQAAAWTMLARVLMNLDEFITRE